MRTLGDGSVKMELQIQGRNFNVNERLRTYVARKVQRLHRHFPSIDLIRVEINAEGTRSQDHRVVAQITVGVNGATILNGEERGATAFAAIDVLVDTLDRRLRRHKGKTYRTEQSKKRREASPRYRPPEEPSEAV